MKIYFGHSRNFDYKDELYRPVRESILDKEHEIIFPHEHDDQPFNSKESLRTCNLMIAEASFPATGLGIEIGWADFLELPLLAIHRRGSHLSGSVRAMAVKILQYSGEEEMINGLTKLIADYK